MTTPESRGVVMSQDPVFSNAEMEYLQLRAVGTTSYAIPSHHQKTFLHRHP